jgi:hypothetical protein
MSTAPATPATRKGFLAAASSADCADDISELLEKEDDPALATLLDPAIVVATS